MVYFKNEEILIRDLEPRDAQILTDEENAQGWHQTIEKYDGAPAVVDALRVMIHCYQRLGYADLAGNTERVFRENFPDLSPELRDSDRRWWKFWQTG